MIMFVGHVPGEGLPQEGAAGKGERNMMDPATMQALATAVCGAAGVVMAAWVRGRAQRHRAREAARRDHLRDLPHGSRVIDLGEHGMVIEVGGAGRELPPDVRG